MVLSLGSIGQSSWTVFFPCLPSPPGMAALPGQATGGKRGGDGDVQSPTGDGGILPLCLPDSSEWQGAQLSMIPDESKL